MSQRQLPGARAALAGALLLTLASLVSVPPTAAQTGGGDAPGYLPVEHLELFAPDEVSVEINLFGAMLKMVSAFVGNDEPEFAELVAGLEAVHVRSGELSDERLATVRERIAASRDWLATNGWLAVVRVAEAGEEVHVYVRPDGDNLAGMAILALEQGEATVVNLVGTIDPATIGRLAEGFDIGIDDLPSLEDLEP